MKRSTRSLIVAFFLEMFMILISFVKFLVNKESLGEFYVDVMWSSVIPICMLGYGIFLKFQNE